MGHAEEERHRQAAVVGEQDRDREHGEGDEAFAVGAVDGGGG